MVDGIRRITCEERSIISEIEIDAAIAVALDGGLLKWER
jgi:hypothetical protein